MERLKLATMWLGGCSGCHMSFLDLDEFLIDLAGMVDIVYTPLDRRQGFPRGGRRDAGRRGRGQRGASRVRQDGPGAHEDPGLLRRLRRDRQRHRHAQPAGSRGGRAAPVLPRERRPRRRRSPAARGYCPHSWTGSSRSTPSCRWMSTSRAVRRPPRGSGRCSSSWSAGMPPSSPGPTSSSAERKKVRPMAQQILIDPVTRIEGHAKITIQLDDAGKVTDARFHVAEFRGFEKFCEGRPFWEMPGITARICGICPVSHLLASAKAGDKILAVTIPPAANKLRRLMNLGQIVQSHALSLLPPERARPAPGHGQRPGRAEHLRPDRRRARVGASGHSPAAVRPGDHRAPGRQEDPSGLVGARRRPQPLDRARAAITSAARVARGVRDRPARPAAVQDDLRSLPRRGHQLRQLPLAVHGPGRPRKGAGSTTTAISDSSTPTARSSPTRSIRPATSNSSARRSSPTPT